MECFVNSEFSLVLAHAATFFNCAGRTIRNTKPAVVSSRENRAHASESRTQIAVFRTGGFDSSDELHCRPVHRISSVTLTANLLTVSKPASMRNRLFYCP
jgi:hypothetical protein